MSDRRVMVTFEYKPDTPDKDEYGGMTEDERDALMQALKELGATNVLIFGGRR